VCVSGGGGDTDGDGLCDADDDCPADVDPEQRDLDGDGIGDVCDPDDAALDVGFLRARRTGRPSDRRLSLVVRGRFETRPPVDRFDPSAGLSLRVRDSGGQEVTSSWASGECRSTARQITCASADRLLMLRFRALAGARYRFRASLRRLAGGTPLKGPLVVTLRETTAVDRVETTVRPRGE
jgi:hypothetical protein